MTTQTQARTRADWMAHEAAARVAANRWAAVAASHEASARRNVWSKSVMVAQTARDNEARCRSAADHARSMAFDVR